MDPALAAALLPLAPSLRLADLGARLTAAGVTDVRVLAELLREEGYDVIADVLGVEESFTEAELLLLETFVRKIGVSAAVQKRVRAAETHADDVVKVLKSAKLQNIEAR